MFWVRRENGLGKGTACAQTPTAMEQLGVHLKVPVAKGLLRTLAAATTNQLPHKTLYHQKITFNILFAQWSDDHICYGLFNTEGRTEAPREAYLGDLAVKDALDCLLSFYHSVFLRGKMEHAAARIER